jgi:hypothetical protein
LQKKAAGGAKGGDKGGGGKGGGEKGGKKGVFYVMKRHFLCWPYCLHLFNIITLILEILLFFLSQVHRKPHFLPKMFVSFLTGLLVLTILYICVCLLPHIALCSMLFFIGLPIFVIVAISSLSFLSTHLKLIPCAINILVFCDSETWCVTIWYNTKCDVHENKVLKKGIGPKMREVIKCL